MREKVNAIDLNVVIKHCIKSTIERLKSRTVVQTIVEINTSIDRMKNEL